MLKNLAFISLLIFFTSSLQAQVVKKTSVNRTELVEYAKTFLGTSYCYAGSTPSKGFDCSGFVSYVFNHFDIQLPRSSKDYKHLGVEKKPAEFQVGDILLFYGYKDRDRIGHVGIICEANGMDSKFIHSSSGKANGVTISELSSKHYSERFYKCISVIL